MNDKKEKYYHIIFHTDDTDLKGVRLSLNLETLVIPKEREVIIPAKFKECADHLEGFSYTLIDEATEKEYTAQPRIKCIEDNFLNL